jgi:hypothetical protein
MSRTASGPSLEQAAGGDVVPTTADRIDPTARVRHFDQLSERAQRILVTAATDQPIEREAPDLRSGDVVRFTDYYVVL